jgi:hypothetical protein
MQTSTLNVKASGPPQPLHFRSPAEGMSTPCARFTQMRPPDVRRNIVERAPLDRDRRRFGIRRQDRWVCDRGLRVEKGRGSEPADTPSPYGLCSSLAGWVGQAASFRRNAVTLVADQRLTSIRLGTALAWRSGRRHPQ